MKSKCIVCYSDRTVTDNATGEVICNNCGVVLAENTEVTTQPRAFSKEELEARSQTGAPSLLARHDMGLSTVIGRANRDASGTGIKAEMKTMMDRLRTWDYRTQANKPKDRNLMLASNELSKLKHKLSLNDAIIEKAAYLYRKAQARRLIRGRTTVSMVAASLYTTCRELGVQRTLKDIADASNVKVKHLSRSYRLLLNEFELEIPVPDPVRAVAKIANVLELGEKTTRDAALILEKIKERGASAGKDPMGLAGSVLYLVSLKNGENVSQRELAHAAGVTEVTIRNRAKELKHNYRGILNL